MGVRQWWAGQAVRATHVLVVEAPGGWRARVAVERELVQRGWHLAVSPADAEALVVAGEPGPELTERVDAVWDQLPGPRARAAVTVGEQSGAALDEVAALLVDFAAQSRDARGRGGPDLDASDSTDMDMDGMDMEMEPSGIPLAEGGEDRDGLEMDVLHLPLGPVLPNWPAGLVLRCSLQGDVIVEATASVLDSHSHTDFRAHLPLTAAQRAARRCDQVADVLALAGWAQGRDAALDVRDALLDRGAEDRAQSDADLDALESLLRRSRVLRWSVRDLGRVDPERQPTVPPTLQGDVCDRTIGLVAAARDELAGRDPHQPQGRRDLPLDEAVALTASLVTGLDLGAARLVVASLGVDTSPATLSGPHEAISG